MKINQHREGEIFILLEATLWGLFPVITFLSLSQFTPFISLAASTFFAGIFFGGVVTVRKKWTEIKVTTAYKDIFLSTLLLGIILYGLYFFGLQFTNPGNASIIGLSEIFFSYLFFQIGRKEYMPLTHIIGAILVLAAAVIVLYPGLTTFNTGDMFILLAAVVAPFGNFYSRRARGYVSSEMIMFIRSIIAAPIIFVLGLIFETQFKIPSFSGSLWFLIINGFLLLGLSKILWIEGIYRISVAKANALASISPLVTLFFAWAFINLPPTLWQLTALVPMFFGTFMLSKNITKISKPKE